MAKKGQRDNDGSGPQSGRNEPDKSVPITAGSPKKQETYTAQAREGKDTERQAQNDVPEPATRDHRDRKDSRASRPGSGRSGSDSNAGS